MFKIETVVRLVALVGLVGSASFGVASSAATTSATSNPTVVQNSVPDTSPFMNEYIRLDCANTKNRTDEDLARCAKYESLLGLSKSTGDGCSDATQKYSDQKGEFSSACGDANISDGGTISCEKALTKCQCADKSNEGKSFGSVSCDDGDSEPSSSRRGSSTTAEKRALSRYKYCPAQAASNYDKIKEDKEKAEDKADELEKDLPTKMDDANQAKSDGQQKVNDIDEKLQQAQTDYGKAQLEAKKQMSDAQRALRDQITQLQGQQQQLDDQLNQLDLAEGEAQMKKDETKEQIRLNCHASAAAQAAKSMGEFADSVRGGTANVGGQKSIIGRVGTTLDTIYDREASKIYDKCMLSTPTIASMDSANKIYTAALNQAESSKASTRKRRAALDDQIKQMKDPGGNCGVVATSNDGTSNETDACRILRESQEAQVQSYNEFNGKMATLTQQKNTAAQDANQSYLSKMNAYQQAQQQATKQRAKADSLDRMLTAAEKSGGDSGVDPKAYVKANSEFKKMNVAAKILLTCQNVCPNGSKSTGSNCQEALKYLTGIGQIDSNFAPDLSQSAELNTTDNGTDGQPTTAPASTTPASSPATGDTGTHQNTGTGTGQ